MDRNANDSVAVIGYLYVEYCQMSVDWRAARQSLDSHGLLADHSDAVSRFLMLYTPCKYLFFVEHT